MKPVPVTAGCFATLDHPVFAIPWLMTAADRLFRETAGRIEQIHIELDSTYFYDDNANVSLTGGAYFHGPGNMRVDEEYLDEIPGVRTFERRAEELWHVVPLTAGDEGGVTTTYEFSILRDRVFFKTETDEFTLEIEVKHADGRWHNRTTIITPHMTSATDILLGDADNLLEQSVDLSDLGIDKYPKVLGLQIDGDKLLFDVELNGFESFASGYQ